MVSAVQSDLEKLQENNTAPITELKNQLQNKENENSNLQSRYSSLKAGCDELQRKQETLQTENSNLLQEHSDLQRNHKTMTDSHLLTERSNTELRKQLQNKVNENSNLQSRYSSLKKGYDELQRKQETLQTKHSSLLQEHSDLQRNYNNMTESRLLTERSNTELKKQLQNRENENSNLQGRYNNLKSSCDELQREQETLQTNHSNLLQEHSDFHSKNNNMTESCLITESSNIELRKELQNKENKNSNLQSRYSSLKASCDELRKQLQNKENENSNLQSRYNSLKSSCDDLQRKQETLQTEHLGLLQEHSDLLRNHNNMTESRLLTERSYTELRKQLQNKENEIYNLQSRYTSLKASCDVKVVFSELSREEGVVLKQVWKWIRDAAVDVTLDPNTANPYLILSADGKQVRNGDRRQALPDNPQRFDRVVSVLAKEGFSSGRHYWEVQVRGKTDWTLGVAKESVNRKGKITVRPDMGYWTLWLRNRNKFEAIVNSTVSLPLHLKPEKLGVYVDYEGGQVSFYNVEARSHIFTFNDTFTEKLYPYFSPHLHLGSKNSAPLIISPISRTD
ncbi:E3 ubiquitin-protein ligase TRIM39 [Amia ocellicauda]|uniref:E3 ubiquitin-protein ligase TRIM39 n=1 Tax=Amia ocellicauda TaxID=2972642 RepID=UPI003464A08A